MGNGSVKVKMLSKEEAKVKIVRLIQILDDELDSLLCDDMSPLDTTLLILLYRNHSEDIMLRSTSKDWTWKKGTLKSQYEERKKNIKSKNSISNTKIEKTTEKFMEEIKKELDEDDPSLSSDYVDEEVDENDPERGSDTDEQRKENHIKLADGIIKSYLLKQADTLFNQDKDRSSEIINLLNCEDMPKEAVQNCIKRCEELHEQLKENISKIHNAGHERIRSQIGTEEVKQVLEEFHKDQMKAVQEIDLQRTKMVKDALRDNLPPSRDLLRNLDKTSSKNQRLQEKDHRWIDEIIGILLKEGSTIEQVKECVIDHLAKENHLQLDINLGRKTKPKPGTFSNELAEAELIFSIDNTEQQLKEGERLRKDIQDSVWKNLEMQNECYQIANSTTSPNPDTTVQRQGNDTVGSGATNEAQERSEANEQSVGAEQSSSNPV